MTPPIWASACSLMISVRSDSDENQYALCICEPSEKNLAVVSEAGTCKGQGCECKSGSGSGSGRRGRWMFGRESRRNFSRNCTCRRFNWSGLPFDYLTNEVVKKPPVLTSRLLLSRSVCSRSRGPYNRKKSRSDRPSYGCARGSFPQRVWWGRPHEVHGGQVGQRRQVMDLMYQVPLMPRETLKRVSHRG